jgi:ABC-2 type transport system permease protein
VTGRPLIIAWKELVQLRRDRLTLAMMVALPLVQLLLFGYAINNDVRHMPTLVYDQDGSSASRELARTLEATGTYDLIGDVRDYDEIDRALRSGRARVALVIPPRYASDLARGRTARLQLIVDGSDPQTVAAATNGASSLVLARANAITLARLRAIGPALAAEPLTIEPNTWYNPELKTAVYIVPGLIGVMLTSMAIARERERGTLEQLIVSPVRSVELIVGKILPYVVIGYVQMTLILAAGVFVFKVSLAGSLPLLYALAFLFIAANLALGLFFSTLAKTQQQAMQMSMFFLLPNILLSGFMFPFEAMPRAAQFLAQLLPLTHFLRIVRGITLKGAHAGDVATEVLWLCGLLGALIALSSLRFSKKIA